MKSRIFTDAELESLKKRIEGIKKDETGIYSARVKPKIAELLERWLPLKKQLVKLMKK